MAWSKSSISAIWRKRLGDQANLLRTNQKPPINASPLDSDWNIKDDAVATRLLAAHDRGENPKPDIAYNLDDGAFTEAELRINLLYS